MSIYSEVRFNILNINKDYYVINYQCNVLLSGAEIVRTPSLDRAEVTVLGSSPRGRLKDCEKLLAE